MRNRLQEIEAKNKESEHKINELQKKLRYLFAVRVFCVRNGNNKFYYSQKHAGQSESKGAPME